MAAWTRTHGRCPDAPADKNSIQESFETALLYRRPAGIDGSSVRLVASMREQASTLGGKQPVHDPKIDTMNFPFLLRN